jgi:hypothetical protein
MTKKSIDDDEMEEILLEEDPEVRQDSSSDGEKTEDEEWEHLIPTNKKLCADWIKYLPYRKQVKIGESD